MRFLITFLVIVTISVHSSAEVINVPDDFDIIQDAVDASEDGDTVLVQPGEYVENINFSGKAISIISISGAEQTAINGNGEGPCVVFTSGEGRESLLHGFALTNEIASGDGYGGGILIERSSPTVNGNIITGNSAAQGGGGISVSSDNCEPLILRNLIFNNETDGGGGGISLYQCSGIILNNTIVGNSASQAGGGINIPFTSGIQIVNNIIVNNGNQGIGGWQAQDVDCRYNDVWNNQGGNYSNVQAGEGSISVDPLFTDMDNNDYHLTGDSPCIDAGDPESDLDPDGTRPDMGAFHFHQKDIEVIPQELFFGEIEAGTIDSLPLCIYNTGGTVLTIQQLSWTENNHPFFIRNSDELIPFELAGFDSLTLWVICQPIETGQAHRGGCVIFSDDPDENQVTIEASCDILNVNQQNDLSPVDFGVNGIYPNPFNSSTTIIYSLLTRSSVTLEIYNTRGQLVDVLLDRMMPAGKQSVVWEGNSMAAGVYLVRMKHEGGSMKEMQKIVIIK